MLDHGCSMLQLMMLDHRCSIVQYRAVMDQNDGGSFPLAVKKQMRWKRCGNIMCSELTALHTVRT